VHLKCPVCEKQERLLVSKFWSGKEKLAHVVELLESGKEYTKHQFEKMDRKEQEKLLKRLNALHAYSVVKFLGT
jgi:glutaredoxin